MSDSRVQVPDLNDEAIDVAVYRETVSIDGSAVEQEVQRVVTTHVGQDGRTRNTSASDPTPVADHTPPVVQLAAGGIDVPAGLATQVLPVTPGRVRAVVSPTHDTGVMWVRFDGGDAADGVGEPVRPGQQWSEYTAAAVSVFYAGTSTVRVGLSELGA